MLDSMDKTLLRMKTIDFYETQSVYHSNLTLYGEGGKLGMEKCEKSGIRSKNFATNVACGGGYIIGEYREGTFLNIKGCSPETCVAMP